MEESPNIQSAVDMFRKLQDRICAGFEVLDPGHPFVHEDWVHGGGGGGLTRVIQGGNLFEKGGVNFSRVKGDRLPAAASARRPHIQGRPFEAAGVSIVMHPRNPFVPTSHMNVRCFVAGEGTEDAIWWFGGGYDLTPYYGNVEDCIHWHRTAKDACDRFDENYYPEFKASCDEYFYLPHRHEARGIGGLFFDDFADQDFSHSLEFVKAVGNSYMDAYLPIVKRRSILPFEKHHRQFQAYRRGRYVEFNLLYDRGTLFGLQSGGRTESILMSLPPRVQWKYNWQASPGSAEAELVDFYLKPRDWATMQSV